MRQIIIFTLICCLFDSFDGLGQIDKKGSLMLHYKTIKVKKSDQGITNDSLINNTPLNTLDGTVTASMVPGESRTFYRRDIGSASSYYQYYGYEIIQKPEFVTYEDLAVTFAEDIFLYYDIEVDFRLIISNDAASGNYQIKVRYDFSSVPGGVALDSKILTIDLTIFPIETPTNLKSKVISVNQIELEWKDNSTNEDGFVIERKTGEGFFIALDTVEANTTSYIDNELTLITEYTYRIYAFNDEGKSDYSNVTTATPCSISFNKYVIDDSFSGASYVCSTDMDGDGDNDILGAADIGDEISWWENTGDLNFIKHVIEDNYRSPTCLCAIDIDGDGDIDILSSADSNSGLAWWENDGIQNFTKHVLDIYVFSNSVSADDVDQDGDIDFITSDYYHDQISWWENDGSENFSKHIITDEFDWVNSIYITDIDNDGDLDILGAAEDADEIAWWENDGMQNFTKHIITSDFNRACAVYVIDMDIDGDADVLGAANWGNEIAWWENDGMQSFTKHTIDDNFFNALTVCATDLDKDGDIDVLGSAYFVDKIVWWINNGSCYFTEKIIVSDYPRSIFPADMNEDGNIDILCASYSSDEIVLWVNEETPGLINNPPQIINIYDLTFDSNQNYIINLDTCVTDEDHMPSSMAWEITPEKTELNVNIDERIATFSAIQNWAGESNVDFKVTDPEGASDNLTIKITVNYVTHLNNTEDLLPSEFSLSSNYPNPFNSATTIQFGLPKSSEVSINIFNIYGQKIENLFEGKKPAGYHKLIWNASDKPSGTYFIRMQASSITLSKKCVLIK
jgi:hypothetical protein